MKGKNATIISNYPEWLENQVQNFEALGYVVVSRKKRPLSSKCVVKMEAPR